MGVVQRRVDLALLEQGQTLADIAVDLEVAKPLDGREARVEVGGIAAVQQGSDVEERHTVGLAYVGNSDGEPRSPQIGPGGGWDWECGRAIHQVVFVDGVAVDHRARRLHAVVDLRQVGQAGGLVGCQQAVAAQQGCRIVVQGDDVVGRARPGCRQAG